MSSFIRIRKPVPNVQHVYTHTEDRGPRVNMKVEKNSRGFNWEVTVTNATDPLQAMQIVQQAKMLLSASFGSVETNQE